MTGTPSAPSIVDKLMTTSAITTVTIRPTVRRGPRRKMATVSAAASHSAVTRGPRACSWLTVPQMRERIGSALGKNRSGHPQETVSPNVPRIVLRFMTMSAMMIATARSTASAVRRMTSPCTSAAATTMSATNGARSRSAV